MTRIRILDGGLGTSLQGDFGVEFGRSTPLWSSHLLVADRDTLLRCQAGFGRVPVDVVLTATYQASVHGFAATRTPQTPGGVPRGDIPGHIDAAVAIAQEATSKERGGSEAGAQVALSVGPYGACMVPSQEYSGRYDEAHDSAAALEAWHHERLELFAEGVTGKASGGESEAGERLGYVALETMPRADEIAAARRALAGVPSLAGVPCWVSALFPGDDEALPDGTPVEEAVRAMLAPDNNDDRVTTPWGIGINCTKTWKLDVLLRGYERAVARLVDEGAVERWPALVLYPDGTNGEVYNTTTQRWEVPDGGAGASQVPWEAQLAEIVRGTRDRGSWAEILVGGCCMASSGSIAGLRRALLEEGA